MSSSLRNAAQGQPSGEVVPDVSAPSKQKRKKRRRRVAAAAERPPAPPTAAAPAPKAAERLKNARQVARAVEDGRTLSYFGFRMKLRRGADRSRLLVTLSTKANFLLFREEFEHDVLFVLDRQTSYYVHNPDRLAGAVSAIADRFGYEKVSIMGGSKAGFGALLIGGLAARLKPSRVIRILAFQPRVFIWPFEPRRIAPGYFEAYVYAATSPRRAASMRKFGDAKFVADLPNVIIKVIHAERNKADRRQARMLSGPNVSHLTVPTAIHNTMAMLKLVRLPEAETRAGVERLMLYVTAEEQRTSGGVDVHTLLRDVEAARHLPSLPQLVEQSFDWTLKPLPPRSEAAARLRERLRETWRRWYWTLYASPALDRKLARLERRLKERANEAQEDGPEL